MAMSANSSVYMCDLLGQLMCIPESGVPTSVTLARIRDDEGVGADPEADPRPRLGLGLADLGDRLGSNPASAGLPGVTGLASLDQISDLGRDRAAIHQILAEAVAEPRGRDTGLLRERGD